MRSIGTIDEEQLARSFGDYLFSQGIENQVDPDGQGGFEIWVLDDNDLEPAEEMLDRFRANPHDPVYIEGARKAERKRKQAEKVHVKRRARVVDGRTMFFKPPIPYGALTVTLIAISVVVAIATRLGENEKLYQKLQITEYKHDGPSIEWQTDLPEIRSGQIWRLVTPIFVHFGILHILFNMFWLKDLGSAVEARKGTWRLGALILAIAVISNVAQFIVGGPAFGGMSGVVFGLFGYIWMQGKFNPTAQLHLHPQTVTFVVIWYVLCLTGMVGPIANTAHTAGAVVGIVWGYLAARFRPTW